MSIYMYVYIVSDFLQVCDLVITSYNVYKTLHSKPHGLTGYKLT
jgi:hypothetical protein